MEDGTGNILIGPNAGSSLSKSASSDIVIGGAGEASQSNAIHIGGGNGTGAGQQSKLYIPAAIGTLASGSELLIDTSTGQIGAKTSSRRFKTSIRPLGPALLEPLMALKPVTFHYKPRYLDGQADTLQYGLIAEEVAKVDPSLVVYGAQGKPFTVAYQELSVLLLGQMQRQQRQIDALRAENRRLARQRDRIAALERELGTLSGAVAALGRRRGK